MPAAATTHDVRALPEVAASSAVAVAVHRTTALTSAAGVLGDVGLRTVAVLALVLAPVLALQGIRAAAALILNTFGWP